MARQRGWFGLDQAGIAANLVTAPDIAVRTGSDPAAAQSWTGMPGFPPPFVPARAGGPVWWWPGVRDFVLAHAAGLPGYQPPPGPPPRPPGKTGPTPGSRDLTAFDVRQIRGMRAQVDDLGRPRYTGPQIASTLPVEVHLSQIYRHGPEQLDLPGAGQRNQRKLSEGQITAMRDLRALADTDGRPRWALQDLAALFGISEPTASRYVRDVRPGLPPGPWRPPSAAGQLSLDFPAPGPLAGPGPRPYAARNRRSGPDQPERAPGRRPR